MEKNSVSVDGLSVTLAASLKAAVCAGSSHPTSQISPCCARSGTIILPYTLVARRVFVASERRHLAVDEVSSRWVSEEWGRTGVNAMRHT